MKVKAKVKVKVRVKVKVKVQGEGEGKGEGEGEGEGEDEGEGEGEGKMVTPMESMRQSSLTSSASTMAPISSCSVSFSLQHELLLLPSLWPPPSLALQSPFSRRRLQEGYE